MISVDVAIIGAGIAGLWTANRLQQQGLNVLLLEHQAIGAGQTIHAQGIIHGGIKYSLTGKLSGATKAIANMPQVWRDCLAGTGQIDLSAVTVLSPHYHLWSAKSLTSKLGTVLASHALKSHSERVLPADYPGAFQHDDFSGQVYQVDEMVVDVPSVLTALAAPLSERIVKIKHWQFDHTQNQLTISNDNDDTVIVNAQRFIFTAGQGNDSLHALNADFPQMQRRPLHMVYAITNQTTPLFAHCVDFNNVPRLTITSHHNVNGNVVWYLGGKLAETGVDSDPETQCQRARDEVNALFPWLDTTAWTFHSFAIDRAELQQPQGKRPDFPSVVANNDCLVAWPTKMAFAPALANQILDHCKSVMPKFSDTLAWPQATLAQPLWRQS